MSLRFSTSSESASSEIDPLFPSLKHPKPRSQLSSYSSVSSDLTIPAIPPTVNFPLPPRRLRPGEIVDIPDPTPTTLSLANRPATAPHTPVSLYGVAIGGNNPSRTNPANNGRAEVKVKTAGMSSLDIRKMSLRNPNSGTLADPQTSQQPEIISMRARNPSRMLAPHHTSSSLHSPSRSLSNAQLPVRRYQHAHSHSTDSLNLSAHAIQKTSNLLHTPPLPGRNLSLRKIPSNPIPRLPPTRQAVYQSLSYTLSSTDEIYDQNLSSIQQPVSVCLFSDHNMNSELPHHPLLSAPSTHTNQPESLHQTMDRTDSGIGQQNGHIKFAPLPTKTITSCALINQSPDLAAPQNTLSKQSSTRTKAAWIQRLLSPATRNVATKPRADISLPVPVSLTMANTGMALNNGLEVIPAFQRRNSVTEQLAPKDSAAKRARPRSRSFTASRPTLGMVADLVQRTPSCAVHHTVASGKSLLTGSEFIVSPIRAHSLQNLIDHPQGSGRTDTTSSTQPQQPDVTTQSTPGKVAALKQSNQSHADCAPESNNEAEGRRTTKTKKKREIRFRNTLELIPDLVFADSPQEILITMEPRTSEAKSTRQPLQNQSSLSGQGDVTEPFKKGHRRRRTPAKNLSIFHHLRKPRSVDQDLANHPFRAQDFDRKHLTVPEEQGINLPSRKLAPKVNLTFVDLDHHIGSRFSVNTLLKEVHKSIPDVKPEVGSSDDEQDSSSMEEKPSRTTNPTRQYSDPVTRQERTLGDRRAQGSVSEVRSEEADVFSCSITGSPTTATSMSNPPELRTAEPITGSTQGHGHSSVIEVVKTDGADVVFQMVVPVAPAAATKLRRREEDSGRRPETPQSTHEEDALTVISERLVALNKSIEAHHALSAVPSRLPPLPHPATASRRESPPRSNSSSLPTTTGVSRRKTKRIEHWLSNLDSSRSNPNPYQPPPPTKPLPSNKSDHQNILDHPDLLDWPESPIDTLHQPSRPMLPSS